jgi:glutamate-ammonia-ligase adenylyltransferase
LAEIMGGAPRLAETLAQRPGILDAVLYPTFFRPLPAKETLQAELDTQLAGTNTYEDVLDVARTFANERKFQVGVQVMRGRADARRAGWMFSDLADVLVQTLLVRTESEFARQNGRIAGGAFGLIGVGKLGARELTAASDLDLIFLYEAPPEAVSDGRTKLPAAAYYVRLAQRLITALSAPTARGRLYEVDARLRPSGIQGQLAVSVDGFLQYQQEEAWTFEHMALTRARAVAGSPALLARALQGIRAVLAGPRDANRLLFDIADLRAKITAQHGTHNALDIKFARGGTLDLEFLAQYLQLGAATAMPQVIQGDTAAAYEALGKAGVLSADLAGRLARATLFLRNVQSVLRATLEGDSATADTPEVLLRSVAKASGTLSTAQLKAELEKTQAWVYERFQERIEEPASHIPAPESHAIHPR